MKSGFKRWIANILLGVLLAGELAALPVSFAWAEDSNEPVTPEIDKFDYEKNETDKTILLKKIYGKQQKYLHSCNFSS